MSVFFTVGHSNRPLDEFLGLLEKAGVTCLVDVRTIPRSRHNPQFNADTLAEACRERGILYRRIPELGGLRGRKPGGAPSPNDFWENESFRNYADYAATPPFRRGLEELRELGRSRSCAIMCAEAVWWRCHRRIVADYLIAAGETVFHIMAEGKLEPAHITEGAVIGPDGVLTYPAAQGNLL